MPRNFNGQLAQTEMQNTSMCFALRASVSLSKIVPDNFVVRRVEELFAFADQIEQQVQTAQGRVNNLTQSILAKALDSCIHALGASPQPSAVQIRSGRICRGELTTQWRADNPDLITGDNSAEALLAKIHAERDALKKSSKPKKKSTAKKTEK